MTAQYDGSVDQMNTLTRLSLVESEIATTKRLLSSPERSRGIEAGLSNQLLFQEAEKAMCELELAGFDVAWPNTRGPQPEIVVGRRSLRGEELSEFLGHLKIVGRCYARVVVDLNGTRLGDHDDTLRGIKDSCPAG